ncbi:unnamed protein product [Calypogeia fissa]
MVYRTRLVQTIAFRFPVVKNVKISDNGDEIWTLLEGQTVNYLNPYPKGRSPDENVVLRELQLNSTFERQRDNGEQRGGRHIREIVAQVERKQRAGIDNHRVVDQRVHRVEQRGVSSFRHETDEGSRIQDYASGAAARNVERPRGNREVNAVDLDPRQPNVVRGVVKRLIVQHWSVPKWVYGVGCNVSEKERTCLGVAVVETRQTVREFVAKETPQLRPERERTSAQSHQSVGASKAQGDVVTTPECNVLGGHLRSCRCGEGDGLERCVEQINTAADVLVYYW